MGGTPIVLGIEADADELGLGEGSTVFVGESDENSSGIAHVSLTHATPGGQEVPPLHKKTYTQQQQHTSLSDGEKVAHPLRKTHTTAW